MLANVMRPCAADEDFRLEVRDFLSRSLPQSLHDKVRDLRPFRKSELQAWQDTLRRQGWLVPNWPKEYGGTGWSALRRWIYEEEYHSQYCPPVHLFNFKMLGPILIRFGNEAQRRRFIPRLLSSEDWWCQGYSEPNAGSDLASLRTRARRDGADYVVEGSKIWTSFAHWADWIFCLVRTNPDAKAQRGISFLLIDLRSPGVTVRPIISIDGRHHFNEVFFDAVRVPAENLVGQEDGGWEIAKSLLEFERLNASRYGESTARLKRLKEIARIESTAQGRLIDQDWFRRRLAEVESQLLAVRYTALRFLARSEAGEKLGSEVSLLKLRGSQVLQEVHALTLQAVALAGLPFAYEGQESVLDGIGPDYGPAAGPQCFSGRGNTIAAGSSEIQREVLAKNVLGLKAFS
jgi:acyl-CoA dehydrogenase